MIFLQKLRDEHGARVERNADHEHDELGHADIALAEEAQVEDRDARWRVRAR